MNDPPAPEGAAEQSAAEEKAFKATAATAAITAAEKNQILNKASEELSLIKQAISNIEREVQIIENQSLKKPQPHKK